jgi:hypothetical protein
VNNDPFIAAIRAMCDNPDPKWQLGIFVKVRYESGNPVCPCSCFEGWQTEHAADCPLKLAFDALDRHDEAFELAKWIYSNGWDDGGPLHILLDDGNCDQSSVEFCAVSGMVGREPFPKGEEVARRLLSIMRQMSDGEMVSLYARYGEYAK